MKVIDLYDGVRARVQPGPGEMVFWIHGYTIDSTLWSDIWTLLPDWYHIGVDLPGHGLSARLPEKETLATLAENLAAAALSLGARHVIGLSLGSLIATEVALSRPHAFATLCLAAPAIAGGPADYGVGRRYRELDALYKQLGVGPWMRQLWMTSPPDLFTYAARNPALLKRLEATIERHRWEEFSGPGVARLASVAQPMRSLKTLTSRTLVLVGEHEFPAFRRTAEILRSSLSDCSAIELPGTGHLCMLEEPNASARAIAKLLNSASFFK